MKRYDWKEVKVWVSPLMPPEEESVKFDLWVHPEGRWVVSIYLYRWQNIMSFKTKENAERALGITIPDGVSYE